jgi:hypothetical protein
LGGTPTNKVEGPVLTSERARMTQTKFGRRRRRRRRGGGGIRRIKCNLQTILFS